MERAAPELQISRVPFWSRRGIDVLFCGLVLSEPADRPRVFANSNPDRVLANVRGRALFIGRRFRSLAWISVRLPRRAIASA
jgi:hypothetical protein